MKRKKRAQGKESSENRRSVRASISFPESVYGKLIELARQKKVSLAWVVRDATEKYVSSEPASAPNLIAARNID